MKILISSTGKDLESKVDQNFGKCPYCLFIETVTMNYDVLRTDNPGRHAISENDITQTIIEKGVKVVITGEIGQEAHDALSNAGVTVLTDMEGPVVDVLKCLIEHEFDDAQFACV